MDSRLLLTTRWCGWGMRVVMRSCRWYTDHIVASVDVSQLSGRPHRSTLYTWTYNLSLHHWQQDFKHHTSILVLEQTNFSLDLVLIYAGSWSSVILENLLVSLEFLIDHRECHRLENEFACWCWVVVLGNWIVLVPYQELYGPCVIVSLPAHICLIFDLAAFMDWQYIKMTKYFFLQGLLQFTHKLFLHK